MASGSKVILLNSTLSGNKSLVSSGGAIFNIGILTGTRKIILGNRARKFGRGHLQ